MKSILMTVVAFAVCLAEAAVRYVSPDGSNEAPYATWETAATDLAIALSAAEAGDEICVASGVAFNPTDSISVALGVTVRGVDKATGAAANATFDGSDFVGERQLLAFENAATAPKFANLTFRKFPKGALAFTDVNGVEIADCVFTDNGGGEVPNGDGGALSFVRCSAAVIERSSFTGNASTRAGGAICLRSTRAELLGTIRDCTFIGNGCDMPTHGGAVYANREIVIENCRFKDNATAVLPSTFGGAVSCESILRVSGCTFTGRANAGYGKCLYATSGIVSNCRFTAVTCEKNADYGLVCFGGGELTNCRVDGSYLYTRFLMVQGGTTAVNVRNLLLTDDNTFHSAFTLVGAYNGKGAVFDNCTILTPNGLLFAASTTQTPHYSFNNCALVGKWPTDSGSVTKEVHACTEPTVSIDALKFVDRAAGNYIPRSDSPLLDKGEALDWQTEESVDLGGRPRVVGEKVDLGCYERQASDTDYRDIRVVATEADRTGDWAEALVGLQTAIDAADDGATRLLVKSGIYLIDETLQITNKSLTVVSFGEDGQPDRDGTVLDGQGVRRILRIVPSPLNPTTFLPTTDDRVVFEGFTFRGGKTHADDGQDEAGIGGGLYFSGRASAKGKQPSQVVNCRFTDCEADFGGGVAMEGGELVDCVFDNNRADIEEDESATTAIGGQGGAVGIVMRKLSSLREKSYTRDATWIVPGIVGCTFTNNTAEASGAAISTYQKRVDGFYLGSVYVADCRFEENALTWPGSKRDYSEGVCVSMNFNGHLTNCFFRANGTATIGYGTVMVDGVGLMTDCTFIGNESVYGTIFGASVTPVFERCRFEDTKCPVRAGGTFRNCLFAAEKGNAVYAVACDSTFDNCTFAAAEASELMYFPANKPNLLTFRNCIFYRPGGIAPLATGCKGFSLAFSSCCFSKEPTERVNMTMDDNCLLNVDPRFADAAKGNWMPRRNSPCVDKGKRLDWMTADSLDLAGMSRVVRAGRPMSVDAEAMPDMGCLENQEERRGSCVVIR